MPAVIPRTRCEESETEPSRWRRHSVPGPFPHTTRLGSRRHHERSPMGPLFSITSWVSSALQGGSSILIRIVRGD